MKQQDGEKITQLSLAQARKILGSSAAEYSDKDLTELLIQMAELSRLYIKTVQKSNS